MAGPQAEASQSCPALQPGRPVPRAGSPPQAAGRRCRRSTRRRVAMQLIQYRQLEVETDCREAPLRQPSQLISPLGDTETHSTELRGEQCATAPKRACQTSHRAAVLPKVGRGLLTRTGAAAPQEPLPWAAEVHQSGTLQLNMRYTRQALDWCKATCTDHLERTATRTVHTAGSEAIPMHVTTQLPEHATQLCLQAQHISCSCQCWGGRAEQPPQDKAASARIPA